MRAIKYWLLQKIAQLAEAEAKLGKPSAEFTYSFKHYGLRLLSCGGAILFGFGLLYVGFKLDKDVSLCFSFGFVGLALAIFARYVRHLAGPWLRTYAITAMTALYLNVFVLVAQLFQKVPALKAMAPTQAEPPFLIAQTVVLALFIVLGILATIRFRIEQLHPA